MRILSTTKARSLCVGLTVLLLAAVSVTLYLSVRKPHDTIDIGVLFPLTGDAASYGEKGKNAIDMAIRQINDSGGIRGKMVRALYEDSRAEPQTGVSAARKLISIDKVPAIVGDIVSSVTLPVAPIVEQNKVVLIAPTSSAPAITNAGEYVYRIWPSDLAEGEAIARYARTHGFKRAAIMHLKNDYGTAIADIFTRTFAGGDASVVLSEGYMADASDFRATLQKIKQMNTDVIYLAGYYGDISKIVRQAQQLGLQQQFLGVTALEDSKFLELAGADAEGIIYPLATGFDAGSSSPIVHTFVHDFSTTYAYEPGWVEAHAFDAFMLVCEAIRNTSGPVNGTTIKEYFATMGNYEGVTGTIRFDENGDVTKPVVFKTVRKGQFQSIDN
jgi:branched-chain amino acid transport system substrate-binding protein